MNLEQTFREEVMRGLNLGQIDRSRPQGSFLKFYSAFKGKYGSGPLQFLEWKKVFFGILAKTAPPLPSLAPRHRHKPKLRLVTPAMRYGAVGADLRTRKMLGEDY